MLKYQTQGEERHTVTMFRDLVFFGLIALSAAKHIPPYITACKRNDPKFGECAKKSAIAALPSIIKGDPEFKYPSLEPFFIDHIALDAGSQISIKLYNLTLKGIGGIQIEDIQIDVDKKHIYAKFFLKTVTIDGKYDIDGRILVVPITGVGPIHLDCENLVVDYTFDYKLLTKKGKEYMDPDINPIVTYKLEKINLKLDNLFNGDKALGDRTNEFLNEHSLEVSNDFSSTFAEAINAIATNILKRILPTVPYDELLL